MLRLSIWSPLLLFFFSFLHLAPLYAFSILNTYLITEKEAYHSRNLESTLPYITLSSSINEWSSLKVFPGMPNSDDLYLPDYWSIFISTNETILSDGTCLLFDKFVCSSPNCYEDTSYTYSRNYPAFSSNELTRLKIPPRTISLANGAWKIYSDPLYLRDCNSSKKNNHQGIARGQIGLGLSGKAYQNFQTTNPIFSIIFHDRYSAQLIFGFNSTYVSESVTSASLACDLDWKIKVNSMAIGNSTLVDNPTTMIFDFHTLDTYLPVAYYSSLKAYFFQTLDQETCFEDPKRHCFYCIYYAEVHVNKLPPIVFNLDNGTEFVFSPLAYAIESKSIYTATFYLYNSTFSGTEYIILGRATMFQYYTVFEQTSDQTPKITLYPVTHSRLDSSFGKPDTYSPIFSDESDSLSQTIPFLDSTLGETSSSALETENITNTNTSEYKSGSLDDLNPTQTENTLNNSIHNGETDNILYTILIVVFIVMIWGIVVYLYLKRRVLDHNKMIKERKPTLELNEGSFLASSQSKRHVFDDAKNDATEEKVILV